MRAGPLSFSVGGVRSSTCTVRMALAVAPLASQAMYWTEYEPSALVFGPGPYASCPELYRCTSSGKPHPSFAVALGSTHVDRPHSSVISLLPLSISVGEPSD